MSIRFRCKKCNQKYEMDDDCAGEMLECVRCKTSMQAPLESVIPSGAATIKSDTAGILDPLVDEQVQEIRITVNARNKAPDDIIFRCKFCNQKYRLPKDLAGQVAECAKCKKNMIVPSQTDNAGIIKDGIVFWCKDCGQKYRLPQDMAGKEGECSKCRAIFTVPEQSEEASRKGIGKSTAVASFIPVVDKDKSKVQKISIHSTTAKNKSPDDILFRCKFCNQKYRLPKEWGGQLVECAKCKKNMVVPNHAINLSDQECVVFWCKACGQKYRLPQELAGQEGECAKCNKVFKVPEQSESKAADGETAGAKSINFQTAGATEKRVEWRSDLPPLIKHFLTKTPPPKKAEPEPAPAPATAPPVIPKATATTKPPHEHEAEKTQTSLAMTKTARSMVKYVLEIPERNFIFVSFSLLIDWLMQLGSLNRLPRKVVVCLFIIVAFLAGLGAYGGIRIYKWYQQNAPQVNVMCISCKNCETVRTRDIHSTRCNKCRSLVGFQWKCNFCNKIFTRVEKQTESNPIKENKIEALKPPLCPFCNSASVKYFAPPQPKPPGPPQTAKIRRRP